MLEVQASDAYLSARAARDELRAGADFLGGNILAMSVRSEANTLMKRRANDAAAAAAATMRPVLPAPHVSRALDRSKFTIPSGFVYPAKRSMIEVSCGSANH
jgi:hypothetical protein